MPPLSVIQPSFSGGEYSPALFSRVDISKYSTGLRKCRNFIIHPHGGASNRPGTKFVARTKYNDKKCRVVRFVYSTDESYVLEFGDYYVRFFTDQSPLLAQNVEAWSASINYASNDFVTYSAATYMSILDNNLSQNPASATTYWTEQEEYEITSPYPEDDLAKLRFESSADVIYITHPDYQTRTLTRYGYADWEFALYSSDDGPFMPENINDAMTMDPSALTGQITVTSAGPYFDSDMVGNLFKLRHYIEGQIAQQSFSGTGQTSGIKCFTTWRLLTHGEWTGTLQIELSADDGSTWNVIRGFSSKDDFNVNTYGTEDITIYDGPFLVRVNVTSYTSGSIEVDLSTDPFYQEGIVRTITYNSSTSMTADVIKEIGSTDATAEWSEGAWSDYRGWPAVARFFQDRLCFSGTYTEPMTTWMTQIGNYISFIRHNPLLDDDGITANLPSRQLNAINGLIAFKKLIALTSASEWTIGAVSGTALTPSTTEQSVEGYRGSWGLDPAMVGNECIYVQANSKVIRNLQYQLSTDGFAGNDLNILARHLFERYTIVDIAYQQDPDSVVWFLRNDGKLLGMTYVPEQEVIAWHWHDTGGGDNPVGVIESICTIPGLGYDELWMSVKRGDYRFIERMSQRIVSATCDSGLQARVENSYFVDNGVTFGETPIRITAIDSLTRIVTAASHGFTNNQTVRLDNLTDPGVTTLNGTSWIIGSVTTNQFILVTEV